MEFLWLLVQLSLSGSLLAVAVLAVTRLLTGRITQKAVCVLWLLVLLRLVIPFGLPGFSLLPQAPPAPAVQITVPQTTTPADAPVSAPSEEAPPSAPQAAFSTGALSDQAGTVLVWVWLAGALLALFLPLVRYIRFLSAHRQRRLPPIPEDQALLNQLCPEDPPALWCDPQLSTPLLAGFFRPAILLPRASYVSQGEQEALTHILRHELSHLRRHDILLKWAAALVTALHWFNPMMFLIRRELSQSCELACDERVIRSMDARQRTRYSRTLLALATEDRQPAPLLTTALHQDGRSLRRRLLRILEHKPSTRTTILLSLTTAAAFLLCGAALGPAGGSVGLPGFSQAPWLSASEEEMTAQAPWLTREDLANVQQVYRQDSQEFQLSVFLPLGDGSYPEKPWVTGLDLYWDSWTEDSPYVLWDIKRQPVRNDNLAAVWMTIEDWSYRGLLRATLLTDLRTRAVWSGEAATPTAVCALSTIQPGCRTHRGIGVGSTQQELLSAYPEAELWYSDQEDSPALRAQGLVSHDACWRYNQHPDRPSLFFLIKEGRVVQIDCTAGSEDGPWGLGYYLDDWAYEGQYLTQ